MNYRIINLTLILLISFFIWFLIFLNYIDLGFGDKAHRALFAYDSIKNTWSKGLEHYLNAPWPPLPYIIQVYFHKLLVFLFKFEDIDFVQSILFSSLFVTILHLLIISEYSNKIKKSWVGTIYIIGFCSFGSLLNYQISAMAESYTIFFLTLPILFFNFNNKVFKIVIIGFSIFFAALCRAEIIILSFFITLFFLINKEYLLGIIFTVISLFPFYIKFFLNLFDVSDKLPAYFTIVNEYSYGSFFTRIEGLLKTFYSALSLQNFISIILFVFLIPMLLKKIKDLNIKCTYSIIIFCGFLYFFSIIFLILIGFVPSDFRYLTIPIIITFFGIIFFLSDQILKIIKFKKKYNDFLIVFIFFIGFFFSTNYVKNYTPAELKISKKKLIELINLEKKDKKNISIIVDHIQFWDMYFMTSGMIEANIKNSASAYDLRPQPIISKELKIRKFDEYSVKLQAYIAQYKPSFLITSTNKHFNILSKQKNLSNDLDQSLKSIDPREKFSYFFSKTYEKNLKNFELKNITTDMNIYLEKIYSNEDVIIYKIIY